MRGKGYGFSSCVEGIGFKGGAKGVWRERRQGLGLRV